MTSSLEALEDWAAGLLGKIEPASRNKLARSIGQELRRSQQQRIIAQRNPDGSKYATRKQRTLFGKEGRVKRKVKMFQKLRTAHFLKVQDDGNAVTLGFSGRVARIAKVHQHGLKDRAESGAPNIVYNQRKVVGFTTADFSLIKDCLLNSLIE